MELKTFPVGNKELPEKFRPIIEYARQKIMAYGIRNFTVEKFVSDLHISKKTIYKYFSTKEEFIEAVLFYNYNELFSSVDAIQPDEEDPIRTVFMILQVIFNNISKMSSELVYDVKLFYPKVWNSIEKFREEVIDKIYNSFIIAQGMGLIRKDIDLKFNANLIMQIVQTVFQPEFLICSSYSLSDIIKMFIDLMMNGLMEKDKSFDFSIIEDK